MSFTPSRVRGRSALEFTHSSPPHLSPSGPVYYRNRKTGFFGHSGSSINIKEETSTDCKYNWCQPVQPPQPLFFSCGYPALSCPGTSRRVVRLFRIIVWPGSERRRGSFDPHWRWPFHQKVHRQWRPRPSDFQLAGHSFLLSAWRLPACRPWRPPAWRLPSYLPSFYSECRLRGRFWFELFALFWFLVCLPSPVPSPSPRVLE